ncbi:AAA family ATPase [Paenibacillus hamazuiensis]|uniref:AAA family ATPase n=1 Tax=Paenibacillus hamazuiensis TaxID=2936508 RepID=UPI00200E9B1C|nr:AAA family ATPase [Paenibacillus hamazuiensis]
MTTSKDEAVRAKLEDLVDKQGLKLKDIAEALGYSHSSLSRYIRKDYHSTELESAARAFLIGRGDLENGETAPAPGISDFYPTGVAVDIVGVCEQCFNHRDIGLIVGESGIGKTTALEKYAASNPKAVYIRAHGNMTQKTLLRKMGASIGLTFRYHDIGSMIDALIEKLASEHVVFLIDEAEYLINPNSATPMRKLEMLRTLHDETESFGLILCGMTRFKGFFLHGPSMKENLTQLWNRVFRGREFGGTERKDVEPIMDRPDMDHDAKDELVARSLNQGGNLRRFMKLLKTAKSLADKKGSRITADIIRQADTLLLHW